MIVCQYCGKPASLVGGEAIYPHRPDLSLLKFWLCKPCDAYVGTHKNSERHAPLGRLANAELRRLKSDVHAAFDPMWKTGGIKRKEAYARLAQGIGIPRDDCHIGMFDEKRCQEALNWLRRAPVGGTQHFINEGEV